MNDRAQAFVHAISGPVILITIGVLFSIDKFTEFGFGRTWPVLIIVIGLLRLVGGGRRDRAYYPPPPPPGSNQGANPGVTP